MPPDYKYLQIKTTLMREIDSGKWAPGMRLPSEATLVRQFGVSRITVGRAVKDLQLAGLIERQRSERDDPGCESDADNAERDECHCNETQATSSSTHAVMARLVPAIYAFASSEQGRRCPDQVRA